MPKEKFSVAELTSLHDLKPGARIHVIAVCGVAMGQIALELASRGFEVSGSDKEYYQPIAGLLKNSSVKCYPAFSADNITEDLDLVIVGNAVSYENVEVQKLEQLNLKYSIFPKILHDLLIKDRHSIVVSGTHGKTTTTAFAAALLTQLNVEPAYFVGGVSNDLDSSLKSGLGKFSVVEGDEYDSAFFAKVPKFSFYTPDTLIINAIEYDHADIYADVSQIKNEFSNLARQVPAAGHIIACTDFPEVKSILKQDLNASVITFGLDSSDAQIKNLKSHEFSQTFELHYRGEILKFELALPGTYNARNAVAAALALHSAGFTFKDILPKLKALKGARRRQEVYYRSKNLILIEDFAHHPTAVRSAIEAITLGFPDWKLCAVFEPRSNTSRKKVFQTAYIEAFESCSEAIIARVQSRAIDSADDLIDIDELVNNINLKNGNAKAFDNPDQILDYFKKRELNKTIILVMSNGSFGGLTQKLSEFFNSNAL